MAQSCHFKKWGRDISFTSRAAASEGNKNSLWVMKGTIIFHHERLSRYTEDKFPHERRSREWGNLFSVWLLSLEWGNIIVPWMTNREFFPSPFFKMTGLTFLFSYWKLFRSATNPWKSSIWLTTESRYGFYLKLEEFENAAKLMKIWRKWIYVIPFPLGEME